MADAFTLTGPGAATPAEQATGTGSEASGDKRRRRVLVTGAAGRIGSYFAHNAGNKYDLRLMVRPSDPTESVDKIRPLGEIVVGELGDLDALKRFCADVDTIVHLAADPSPSATWQSLLDSNIVGTYHVFAAAKAAGSVRRVIYASSIHAVSGYPKDMQVHENHPVNPGDLYGVSKCFGEALCRYMAEQEGVSAIALRIGAFQPLESARGEHGFRMMDAFVSQRDLNQLIHRCIDAADTLRFAIFHGLSDNRFKRMDISSARQLVGYTPEDDATREAPQLRDLRLFESVPGHNVADRGQKSGLREDL